MKILVAGDSFAAQWANCTVSWTSLLDNEYIVNNIAQPGVGEYKILKQLETVNIDNYDCVIVSHTSPSRIHIKDHPIHKSGFHKNCDLIFNDIDRFTFLGSRLDIAKKWFVHYYDDMYQCDIYNLIRKEINNIIHIPYISMSHIDILKNIKFESVHLEFSKLWSNNRGLCNHYNDTGNEIIFNTIKETIKRIT